MINKLKWLSNVKCVKPQAIKQIIVNQSNNKIKLANTKVRSEINKTNKKAYRQKGTGSARRGQLSSPLLIKGGQAMGPRYHIVSLKDNRKLCKQVRLTLLKKHMEHNNIIIKNIDIVKPCTKQAVEILKSLNIDHTRQRVMIITHEHDVNIKLSFKNLYYVSYHTFININNINLAHAHKIIITEKAAEHFTKQYGEIYESK